MAVSPLQQMVGKRLLVGVTYLAPDGAGRGRLQFAGVVTSVEPLVSIERGEGYEPFALPPAVEAFKRAPPGEYHLDTGEVVVDPDFTTTWSVNRVPPESAAGDAVSADLRLP